MSASQTRPCWFPHPETSDTSDHCSSASSRLRRLLPLSKDFTSSANQTNPDIITENRCEVTLTLTNSLFSRFSPMPWPAHFQAAEAQASATKRANDEIDASEESPVISDLEFAALHAGVDMVASAPSSLPVVSKPHISKSQVARKVASFLQVQEEV